MEIPPLSLVAVQYLPGYREHFSSEPCWEEESPVAAPPGAQAVLEFGTVTYANLEQTLQI